MSTFNTKKTLFADPSLIATMGDRITKHFSAEGYEVVATPLSNGGYDISITKGNMFKAVLGMKTALKVSLTPQAGNILFDAGVGIFGQQAIPTVISMFFFWPVLITQISGMIKQSKLDDLALSIAEQVVAENPRQVQSQSSSTPGAFCTNCGHPLTATTKFCPNCGAKVL